MNLLTVQMIGVAAIALTLGIEYWRSRRSEKIIRGWAQSNNYRWLQGYNTFPFAGPFFWRKSGKTVFRVSLLDATGKTRKAWILCGKSWLHMFPDTFEVRWDE